MNYDLESRHRTGKGEKSNNAEKQEKGGKCLANGEEWSCHMTLCSCCHWSMDSLEVRKEDGWLLACRQVQLSKVLNQRKPFREETVDVVGT